MRASSIGSSLFYPHVWRKKNYVNILSLYFLNTLFNELSIIPLPLLNIISLLVVRKKKKKKEESLLIEMNIIMR